MKNSAKMISVVLSALLSSQVVQAESDKRVRFGLDQAQEGKKIYRALAGEESFKTRALVLTFDKPKQASKEDIAEGRNTVEVPLRFLRQGTELNEKSRFFLDAVAVEFIRFNEKSDEDVKLKIVAHTDVAGPADYNQQRTEKYATTVKNYLLEKFSEKITGKDLVVSGAGETAPAYSPYMSENNRIELSFLN